MSASDQVKTEDSGEDYTLRETARYVPAPHTATEKAAMEAALAIPTPVRPRSRHALATRVMTGAALVAIAVVLPDLSLGAMGKPETRVAMDKAFEVLPQSLWTPTARSGQPVYAPIRAAEQIAPEAIAFSRTARDSDFNRIIPIAVLESGSERFDLAFAGGFKAVELPQARMTSLSGGLPQQAPPSPRLRSPAVRTRAIDIPQIAKLPPVERKLPGVGGDRARLQNALSSAAREAVPVGAAPVNAAANTSSSISTEPAFAGPFGASADARGALPAPPQMPAGEDVVRALPLSPAAPDAGLDAAREAALVPKSKLDARINGILTGHIDFRQLDGTIALRLRSVLGVLRDQFSDDEFAHLLSGTSADRYVPLAELQSAGIPVRYNPAYDEVDFGIDYKDAPNAKKVQIPQIGIPGAADQSVMIEQIPR